MRFVVFGAGALGSLVAAKLARSHRVLLVGRAEHVEAIRRGGLRVTGESDLVATTLEASTEVGGETPDAVLLTVKAYDTAAAVEALEPYHGASIFVSLQNGLGNEERIAERAKRVLGAVINEGVTFVEPGHVYHAGAGGTTLGPFQGTSDDDAENVAAAFNDVGLRTDTVSDIRTLIWTKAVLNAAVNPLTALLGERTGALATSPHLWSAVVSIVTESVRIAAAAGVALDEAEVLATIRAVCEKTRNNKSSMLQDLERGRRTEIREINGALSRIAGEKAVPAPLNALLTALVSSREPAT